MCSGDVSEVALDASAPSEPQALNTPERILKNDLTHYFFSLLCKENHKILQEKKMAWNLFRYKKLFCALLLLPALFFVVSSSLFSNPQVSEELQDKKYNEKMYFATVSDTQYYYLLKRLLDSIYTFHKDQIGEIAVFDIGLSQQEKDELSAMPFVKVFAVEETNPLMFTIIQTNSNGALRRGWYSYKPVVMKQALDLYPIVFYIDAGLYLTGPMDLLFCHLKENGYFLVHSVHPIGVSVTNFVREQFELNKPERAKILDQPSLESGFQGLTRQVYDSYVMPVYELSKDIRYFVDDGSAPWGFGGARHDQTLFSIRAELNNMTSVLATPTDPMKLHMDGKDVMVKPMIHYVRFKW